MALPLISIDGPAGSGKSTTAREAARRLGLPCLDTGALYRAAAWAVINRGVRPDQPAAVAAVVEKIRFSFLEGSAGTRVWVDGREVTAELRSPEVTRAVTPVCEVPEVRTRLVAVQRRWAERGFGIMEGRDIGTVVIPQAGLKVFLTASPEVRALRRARELGVADDSAKVAELAAQIEERDRRDRSRPNSPLMQTPDMVVVDNSRLTVRQQVDEIIRLAAARFDLNLYAAVPDWR